MKHTQLPKIAFSGIAVVITAGLMAHFLQLLPARLQPNRPAGTPIISFSGPNTSDRPTLTAKGRAEADAPGPKLPTSSAVAVASTTKPADTPNAPKQSDLRARVTTEHTYYPLVLPNDPGYSGSWALQRTNAPAGWAVTTGNSSTVVAVIDTGFALNHEDLTNSWYTNPRESGTTQAGDSCWTGTPANKASNNCDDDGNGYVDDWRGWNFYLQDNDPMAGRTNPNGQAVAHGTETAGLAGATGNNGKGIATINWATKVMPLQVLSDDGPGYTSDVAAAIYYAVDNGASVISMSLGGFDYDPWLSDAVAYAYSRNIPVVAAAGNCGTGSEAGCSSTAPGAMMYPALYDHVVAVGASDSANGRASFSSYGPRLDVMAPGSGTITSPTWTAANATSLYSGALYGTSYAAPQVASLVSLIKSIRPTSSVEDVRALLMATATRPTGMNGQFYTEPYGQGIINAGQALAVASNLNGTTATPSLLQAGGATSEHSYRVGESLGSGCTSTASTYCTVRLRSATGNERYLPYQQLSGSSTGWTWSTQMISSKGSWEVQAFQGDRVSTVYSLFNK